MVLLRSEEYGKIWTLLEMFMDSNDPLTMIVLVWGGPGTGKTTVAKRLMESVKHVWKNLRQIYLDSEVDGGLGLFNALQHACGLKGYSGSEIFSLLEKNRSKLLIVVDNAETLLSAEERVPAILRIGEAFPEGRFFILILFRSENIPIDVAMVPSPVYPIYFKPYTFEEIRSMLEELLKEYESFSVDEKALDIISRIASSCGNAWLALEILKTSLKASRDKRVDETLVLAVSKKLFDNPLTYMGANISDTHERIILKIVSKKSRSIRFKHLFEEYRKVAWDNGVKPLGYTQIWKRMKRLEKRMLLDFKVTNFYGGRAGMVEGKDFRWMTGS